MKQTEMKLSLICCLLIALSFFGACTKPPEPKAGDAMPAAGTSVENAAGAAKTSGAAASVVNEPLMTEEVHTAFARSCQECHGADGHGITAVAPDLRVSPKRSVAEWEKYLRNPKSVDPKATKTAPRGLSDEEIAALAAYLADLTQHNPPPGK